MKSAIAITNQPLIGRVRLPDAPDSHEPRFEWRPTGRAIGIVAGTAVGGINKVRLLVADRIANEEAFEGEVAIRLPRRLFTDRSGYIRDRHEEARAMRAYRATVRAKPAKVRALEADLGVTLEPGTGLRGPVWSAVVPDVGRDFGTVRGANIGQAHGFRCNTVGGRCVFADWT